MSQKIEILLNEKNWMKEKNIAIIFMQMNVWWGQREITHSPQQQQQ